MRAINQKKSNRLSDQVMRVMDMKNNDEMKKDTHCFS